jgi:hypothetical protein
LVARYRAKLGTETSFGRRRSPSLVATRTIAPTAALC